ncbi:MAG TPA: hypothetical protein VNE40_03455 [Candidatus Dormibacteraeota bacterium]|nr:hypothetical protein [Candidatus Dormibacteraeota bacterium]
MFFKHFETSSQQEILKWKALELLISFHALKYPELHPSRQIFLSEENGTIEELDLPSPEDFLRANTKASERALYIRDLVMPIWSSLQFSPDQSYETLIDYCRSQLTQLGEEDLFNTPHGQPLAVTEILPPRPVVEKMHDDYIVNRLRRCSSLEAFIDLTYRD